MKKHILISFLLSLYFTCPNDQYCVQCKGDQCIKCYESINKNGRCVTPLEKIDQCVQYVEDGKCSQCNYQYKLTKQGRCDLIEKNNCISIQHEICVACPNNVRLQGGYCSEDNECDLNYCSLCRLDQYGLEQCLLCYEGYSLYYNDGQQICEENKDEKLQGCHFRNLDGSRCEICLKGFFMSNGQCKKSETQTFKVYSKCNNIIYNLFLMFLYINFQLIVFGFYMKKQVQNKILKNQITKQ